MHDHSTRAWNSRRHSRAVTAAAVVAVLALLAAVTVLAPTIARSAQPADNELSAATNPAALPGEAPDASHDIAIQMVAPGKEGLQLSARLTDDGNLIDKAISWTIMSAEGVNVFSGEAPEANILTSPGDYTVTLRYGAVELVSTVTLLEANHLMVSYVLNAGGIRILPRVQDLGLSAARPISRVFALEGRRAGRLVAASSLPGEIIRLPEGAYRVESGFLDGNVSASTEVRIKAGRMSGVEINHKAGVARLAFVGAPDSSVEWQVTDDSGAAVIFADGLAADVVLKPGTYTASAHVAGETLTATFGIAVGETRDIILGN